MIPSSVFDLIKDDLRLVEECMSVQSEQDLPDLKEVLRYLIQSGGKRLRPILTLLSGSMLGANHEQIVTLAAGIEMLHTATLVHDDLIDGALFRRRIPTLNSHWSPAATVLSGDYLFARAAGLVARSDSLPAMRLFAETLAKIVNGEVSQYFSRGLHQATTGRVEYYRRIEAKTAALFRASAMVAGLVSPVAEEIAAAVGRYGYEIGMAFQIVDDVLDFDGDPAVVGKPVGSDLHQGIVTLPVIYYREMRPDDPDLGAVLDGNKEEGRIVRLIEAIRQSGAASQALEEARTFTERASAAIANLPRSREHDALDDLARFISERNL